MTKVAQNTTLAPSRDIPFNKLVLSKSNVRPVLDADGIETVAFEIPVGGRRFQVLALLVKQKRRAKTAPIPCIVRDAASDILAKDDSLPENMQRVALHPLDQFRAFVALRTKTQREEAIAAAFFVTPQIVKLASVDPALLDRLVAEKLQAKGWKWIEVATDLPYGYNHGLRRLAGDPAPMTDEESVALATLIAAYRALDEEYSGQDEYTEEIDTRLEMAIEALEQRPLIYETAEVRRLRHAGSGWRPCGLPWLCPARGQTARGDRSPG